jgi:hypothetical protein
MVLLHRRSKTVKADVNVLANPSKTDVNVLTNPSNGGERP